MLNAFITRADSRIDNADATASDAFFPLTLGLSKAVGNFLLCSFIQSVTNGAKVFVSNLLGGGADLVDVSLASALAGNHSKLAAFATKSGVNTSKLQSLSRQLTQIISGKSKRDDGATSGFKGAITNVKQTVDTPKEQLDSHDGYAGEDVVNAVIPGLDSQIDNLAATLSTNLSGVTLGISGEVRKFLLGPIVQ